MNMSEIVLDSNAPLQYKSLLCFNIMTLLLQWRDIIWLHICSRLGVNLTHYLSANMDYKSWDSGAKKLWPT